MTLKQKISIFLSIAIIFNMITIFPIAIEPREIDNQSSRIKVPISEWYLPGTNNVYLDFYNSVKSHLPNKNIEDLTEDDFKSFTGDIVLPEMLYGIPPVINRFTEISSLTISSPIFNQNDIPDTFFEDLMPNFTEFVLKGSEDNKVNIQTLPENFLQNAPKLSKVEISYTNLTKLPDNFARNSNEIIEVSIHDNKNLKSVPDNFLVNTPDRINHVNLSNNALEKLPDEFLKNMSEATSLNYAAVDLHSNNLVSIPESITKITNSVSSSSANLEILDISDNQVIEYTPLLDNVQKYYSYGNLFSPKRDDSSNFSYYYLSPKPEFYSKNIKFPVNSAITSQELITLMGNGALLNNTSGHRKDIAQSHELRFVPSDEYASMFDSMGVPTSIGTAKGYIEFAGRTNQANLKTNIITIEITEAATSSDSTLKYLNMDNATLYPAFSPDIISYSAILNPDISSSNVTAVPNNSNATVSGDLGIIEFYNDSNEIKINVISEDKRSSTTYTLTVEKTTASDADISLSALDIGNGITLNDFNFAKNEYTLTVPNDKTFVEINPTTNDPKAKIISDDIKKKIHLLEGENIFTFKVVAPNSTDSLLYKISITRDSATPTTDNASLTALSIDGHNLSPIFSSDVTQYKLNVSKDTTSITVRATGVSGSTVEINGVPTTESNINLNSGLNNVNVKVTSAEGYSREYTITVDKNTLSNDATLSSLSIEVGGIEKPIDPIFDPNTNEYTVDYVLEANDPNPVINATTTHPAANVYGIGIVPNFAGTNGQKINVPITVVAEDGVTTNIYNVKIGKLNSTSPASDPKLSSISITNTNGAEWFVPFHPDIDSFEVVVPYETSSTNILAQSNNINATLDTSYQGTKNLNVGKNEFKIIVNSEDKTSTKEYTFIITRKSMNRPASSDNKLLFLEVKGQILAPAFDPNIQSYYLNVDNSVDQAEITAIKSSYYANVNIIKTKSQSLNEGENQFLISVTAEDKSINNYTITINRSPVVDSTVYLSDINITSNNLSGPPTTHPISPVFDENITNYNVEVPYKVNQINITANPKNPTSTITGDGQHTLNTGNNIIELTVTSQDQSVSIIYTINVTRGPSQDASLSDLQLTHNSSIISLTPSFNSNTFEYSAEVNNDVDKINIIATTTDPKATIRGNLTDVSLDKGLNIIQLTVIAEDGTTSQDIIIRIERKKSSDASLLSLEVLDSEYNNVTLTPTFDENVTSYNASVSENDKNIIISANPKGNATIDPNLLGLKNLSQGNNIFNIEVVAEDGITTKTYTLNINKPISTDSSLKSLSIKETQYNISIPLNPSFSPTTYDYNIDIGSFSYITIDAIAISAASTISGNGDIVVKGANNKHVITVTAEDGSSTEYNLNITKNASSNNNLSTFGINEGTISPAFSPDILEYTATVPHGTDSVYITATTEHEFATVTGDKEQAVSKGDNELEVIVTAEDNSTKTYKITVHVQLSNDTLLGSLDVKHNGMSLPISPSFNQNTDTYTLDTGSDVDKITIEATTNDPNANLSGDTGEQILRVGSQVFTITVTAEDGTTTKDYKIVVTKASSSDSTLSNLTVSAAGAPQTLSPSFVPNITNYTLNVPNDITSIDISATPNHPDASVSGDINTQSLNVGENIFNIVVTAADTSKTTYTVTVIRAKSSNAALQSLKVNANNMDLNLNPSFTPGTLDYTISVDNSITSVNIQAIAQDSAASVTGQLGKQNINVGNTTFTITVTAEDGITTQNYTVNITRAASNDATLSDITVTANGSPLVLSPIFDPATTTYTISVDNTITSINIAATKNHAGAVITGTGDKSVNVGTNTFIIDITAEDGSTTKSYTLNIIRAASTDSSLKLLKVLSSGAEQALNPNFSPSVKEYTITVANSIDSIDIQAEANHSGATISGTGSKILNVGENTFTIEVLAEDKATQTTYQLKVTRLTSDDATLNDLKVTVNQIEQPLTPNFESSKTSYTLNVTNDVTTINISATTSHTNATTSGDLGDLNVNVGDNKFIVTVTAPDGVTTLDYTITVARAPSANATLSDLTVSSNGINHTLTPSFNGITTKYTLTVQNNITAVKITATAVDSTATITGQIGDYNLNVGVNTFNITVTAQDGVTNTNYTVEITRLASSNANLASLEVLLNGAAQTLTPAFTAANTNYTVNVPEGTSQIEIRAIAEDSTANISGKTGVQNIIVGTNTFTITVTAEDGTTKNYTLNIIRPISTNSSLSSLELSSNGTPIALTPNFSSAINSYTLEVLNEISSIKITATPSFAAATITGDLGVRALNVGENIFNITVIAEDGTSSSTYTIKVTRLKSTDATLSSIILKNNLGEIIPITPVFDPNNNIYSSRVINTIDMITIEATTSNINATIGATDLGSKNLIVGDNKFDITVTAEDNTTVNVYSISILRSEVVQDVIITGLPTTNTIEMNINQATDLEFSFYPLNSFDDIIIISSNPAVATMELFQRSTLDGRVKKASVYNSSMALFGRLTTHAAGNTTITVSTSDGRITKSFNVFASNEITTPNVPVVSVDPTNPEITTPIIPVTPTQPENIVSNNPITSESTAIYSVSLLLILSSVILITMKRRKLKKEEEKYENSYKNNN